MGRPAGGAQAEAERSFRLAHPEYGRTRSLDELRTRDYGRLDRLGHVYLDYTGSGLYADFQVQEHAKLLLGDVLGNPHSTNPSSLRSTKMVEEARAAVLAFFNASPDEYAVVFTQNASGALKLVGEAFPFGPRSTFLLSFDNHNSVNGIREYARAARARVRYAPVIPPDLRLDEPALRELLDQRDPSAPNLFAFPAQSNFSGVRHCLEWVSRARDRGWQVLLDAAAFVPTARLDLDAVRPDFTAVSFYKIFGYPTSVGCLIARKAALAGLRRPWFAGGTITVASVRGDRHYLQEGPEAFEDGTLNFLGLPAVTLGLRYVEGIGIDKISLRTSCLLEWLLGELSALRHANGRNVVRIYGPTRPTARGATVTFNIYDPEGRFIDHAAVEQMAGASMISVRTGCFCNPGAGEVALGIEAAELATCFAGADQRLTLDDFRRCIDGKSTGAVRASLGVASNFADVFRFVEFARGFVDRPAAGSERASRAISPAPG
jgi:selenocysteine lyase/cysteine desulfurase